MKGFILTLFSALVFITAGAQTERGEIRSGNAAFKKGNYQKAEIDYRRALEKNPNSLQAKYNLGNALYKLNNSDEAEKIISPLVDSVQDNGLKAKAFHNLGNFNLSQKKYKESIESYKNALRINPGDIETKSNLAYAQKMLKNEQNKQNKDQNKDQDQDKNKDKNKDQNKDQNQDKNKDNKQQPPPKISPEAAQQMLQAIQNKEKETQDKVKNEKVRVSSHQKEKNW